MNQRKNIELGQKGEQAALDYLAEKGYSVVARNWHCPGGEVDLILRTGRTLVFAEVRTRSPGALVHPFETITAPKQRRVARAAEAYLRRHDLHETEVRFDALAVTFENDQPVVEHLEQAFETWSPRR